MAESEPTEKAPRRSVIKARYDAEKGDSRLSLPFFARLPIATTMAFLTGMGMGLSHGSNVASLRFRAENAHRLPQSPTGWYLYHKSKNYNVALGGVKEGLKMGSRMSVWVAGFVTLENVLDEFRGTKDFFNTVGASLVVAGGFSLWNRFPVITTARTAKSGLAIGLAYGLAQDALGLLRGRRLGYVDLLTGKRRKNAGSGEVGAF